MTLNSVDILTNVKDHATKLGTFERVIGHEPKVAPGQGLTASFWVESVVPVARHSGLAATSAKLTMTARLYHTLQSEPQDDIDPALLAATDALLNAYNGDFTLNDEAAYIDILGAHGTPLSAQAGYLKQDDGMYRVFVVTIPIIISDCWTQEA